MLHKALKGRHIIARGANPGYWRFDIENVLAPRSR